MLRAGWRCAGGSRRGLTELDRATIERKLVLLLGYVDELEPLVGDARRRSAGNVARRALERLVQLIVETVMDANGALAADGGFAPPASGRESFDVAERLRAVSPELAQRFRASYVGLRNRIVHEYETLDETLVLRAARRLVGDVRGYVSAVRSFLSRPSGTSSVREKRVPCRGRGGRAAAESTRRGGRAAAESTRRGGRRGPAGPEESSPPARKAGVKKPR
jgi:uncharacterized protein YutE (UPF0331/DUF86 family)